MSDTSIRVSDETKRRLELEKREGESFDDVLRRLTASNRWSGFGVLADEGPDTKEGLERMRRDLRRGFGDDIDGSEESR